ncbi:MAG: hypothetical protein ACNA8W_00985 [Bradymonadaceae bacterium]
MSFKFVTRLVSLCVLVAIFLPGCAREFDPYWKINKFRVLAIKADPVTLRHNQVTTLTALVHAEEGREISYQWDWCPVMVSAQNDYQCPFTSEDIAALLGEAPEDAEIPAGIDPTLLDFDLGDGPTARLQNPFPAPMILGFCQAIRQQIADAAEGSELEGLLPQLDCERGYDITVRLIARSGGEEIIAVKRFTLYTGAEQININPRQDALQIRPAKEIDAPEIAQRVTWLDASAPHDDQWHTLPEDEPTPFVLGIPLQVRALVDGESVETWRPPAPRGDDRDFLDPRSEVLTYRWFATAGTFRRSRLLFVDGENTLEEASQTTFTLDSSRADTECTVMDGECRVKIWNVVRDGRLGLDWIERELVAVE